MEGQGSVTMKNRSSPQAQRGRGPPRIETTQPQANDSKK